MDVLEQRKHEAILFTFKQVRVLYQYCKELHNSCSCKSAHELLIAVTISNLRKHLESFLDHRPSQLFSAILRLTDIGSLCSRFENQSKSSLSAYINEF